MNMMRGLYHPGEYAVFVDDRSVIMTGSAGLDRLVALIGQDVTMLRLLTALSDGDLAATPSFAAAVVEDRHVVVAARGDHIVECHGSLVDGSAVTTWTERRFPVEDGSAFRLRTGDQQTATSGLPLDRGVVFASEITWSPGRTDVAPIPRAGRSDSSVAPKRGAALLPSGKRVEFSDVLVLGRAPQPPAGAIAVTIDDGAVSSTHAIVEHADGQLAVSDRSTNGTALSPPGQSQRARVTHDRTPLSPGSTLWLTDDIGVVIDLA